MKQYALAAAAVLATTVTVGRAQAAVSTIAYYVSPNGADSSNGLTVQTAFKTLERARAGMVNSKIKMTYLLGGLYHRTATLSMSQDDNGETWRNYPGQVPVVDGGGSVTVGMFLSGSSNVTLYGMTFQNFVQSALQTHNTKSIVIKDNTILNTRSTGWVQGAVNVIGTFQSGLIQHNLIKNANYNGISVAPDQTANISGTIITDNTILNSCLVVSDCGAIYVEDPIEGSKNVWINHNLIGNFGSSNNNTHAIYLDNLATGVKVTNNIVYGSGMVALMVHGGHANLIKNNIFDISGLSNLALYQQNGSDTMAGNEFLCNIVYSSVRPPGALWVNIGNGIAPNDWFNAYWTPNGKMPNIGITDVRPITADPSFANRTAGNYTLTSSLPAPACFTSIAMNTFGPEPGI